MLKARILLAIWFYLFNTSTYNSHIYTYVYITKSETIEKTEFSMNTEHLVITPETATIIEEQQKNTYTHTNAKTEQQIHEPDVSVRMLCSIV